MQLKGIDHVVIRTLNLEAMIDRWLRLGTGPQDDGLRARLRGKLRAAYDPTDPLWRERVIETGRSMHVAALEGLCAWQTETAGA